MVELLEQLNYWHWLGLGAVLLIFELFGAGAYLLWVGLAAVIVGVIKYFVPELSWEWQFIIFAVDSLAVTYAWWLYQKKNPKKTDEPTLNLRVNSYIGRKFKLKHPIIDGQGKLNIDDCMWIISGEDMPAKTVVKIVGVNDMILLVEKAV